MTPDAYLETILHHGQTRVEQTLGVDEAGRFRSQVWSRYYQLERTAPRFQQRVNRRLFVAAVPLLAIYQVLREDFSMQQEPALGLAEQMLRDAYAVRTGIGMVAALNATYQLRPIRNLLVSQMMKANESNGFHFEHVDEPDAVIALDVRGCPIVNFAKQHGAPEIVPIICRMDDLIAQHLWGMELHRSGTIGMGADHCDFRYVRKVKD